MNHAAAASMPASIFLICLFGLALAAQELDTHYTYDHGGIIRGDRNKREIALVFTGDTFADGGTHIRQVLSQQQIKASFFLTGNFYREPNFKSLIEGLIVDGHYLGAHSDAHLLYCVWENRDSLLVTQEQFIADLAANYQEMEKLGIAKTAARYFLPPYEWYNATISAWAQAWGLQLINYTPGTRSPADYTYPEMQTRYAPSATIFQSILSYETSHAGGLNGFILLSHIGTDPRRTDKFYFSLEKLLQTLREKGYRFKRIDELLERPE
ncbi:polysaccharide deacetylase family protein [candidate division KSB1 bacterium]|nr:polysaccharide deacetylase family protein [candidate division KSB1 bacterium]